LLPLLLPFSSAEQGNRKEEENVSESRSEKRTSRKNFFFFFKKSAPPRLFGLYAPLNKGFKQKTQGVFSALRFKKAYSSK